MADNKEPIKPIIFGDTKVSPISFMNKDSESGFSIMRTTAGGKYVRGDHLVYKHKGVEIYAPVNSIIFVDLENDRIFIRENKSVLEEIAPSNPELKQYIVLYTDLGYENSDEEFPLRWEANTGRKNIYDNIKVNAPIIDIDKSIVLAENVGFNDALTVREFVNYLKNAQLVDSEDGFDINEYYGSEGE